MLVWREEDDGRERLGCFESRVGVLSVCRGMLAVRGHEDDRLGCHSPPLSVIGCDVPRWTSAQPGPLWLTAPPVHSNANMNCTISCFRGRTRHFWHQAPASASLGCRPSCPQGLFGGSFTACVCFFYRKKTPNKSLQNFNVRCQRDRQPSACRMDECLLIIH